MRLLISFLILIFLLNGCDKQEKYSVDHYYSQSERDSLLTDIITYIYARPPHATPESRFDKVYRGYYVSNLSKFQFEKYFISDDGTHYFYIIRPARTMQGDQRGVGGKFNLDSARHINQFREIFDTPASDSTEVLIARGNRLFNELIIKGNVDDYVPNPDYIEWPDKMTYYDTVTYEWLIKPGI